MIASFDIKQFKLYSVFGFTTSMQLGTQIVNMQVIEGFLWAQRGNKYKIALIC